jgi:Protein of unknown function (DUF3108)
MGVVTGENLFEMKLPGKKTFGLLCLIALMCVQANAQKSHSSTVVRPFEPHEELYLEAEFSRSLLRNLDIADLRLLATRTPAPNLDRDPKVYTLTLSADVSSKGFFARLFNLKFRERVESIVDPVSFTVRKTTILDEQGKRVRSTETTFDHSKGTMSWTVRDPNNPSNPPRHAVTDYSGQIQDILSAIYFIRTQPLEVGKTFEMSIGDGGRIYRVPIKVIEKRRMKTLFGKVNVFRVDPDVFGEGKLIDDEKGAFSLWITDDARRLPIVTRVKTDYGTFEIKLKRVVTKPSVPA